MHTDLKYLVFQCTKILKEVWIGDFPFGYNSNNSPCASYGPQEQHITFFTMSVKCLKTHCNWLSNLGMYYLFSKY